MPTFATPDGTKKYAARFAGRAATGHFREHQGLWLSSVGIGTYLGEADARTDQGYTDAIVAAVESGVNVIDTAINYRFQRSERSVGAAIAELARRGYGREELVICTKGGFLTPDGDMPADATEYFNREYVETGILREGDVAAGCHSIAPKFIADQLERSRRNLGVETIDVYYLHNPETQLAEVPREMFNTRVRSAFEFLESAVAAAKIHFYGLATWNGFRQGEKEQDFLSLAAMESLARDVAGGSHHFRFVQLPCNLGMTEALTRANQELDGARVPAVGSASKIGVTLIASASMLQGKLSKGLPPFVTNALGMNTDVERAMQFVRSTPGIATALVGMSRVEHVRENLKIVGVPPASQEQFAKLFQRGEKA
ncbi:MAG TPA: aldo/keto reductase [Candidatus Acidoferrales bacterium]|jgi:aryl-alcohol dehydrogenase-like predicted oxidoreductase|nr:aldo/keto reductase [Candidatus Acidoferrales bacterium]